MKEETLRRFHIGYAKLYNREWMTIPSFSNGKLKGIKLRNLDIYELKTRYMSIEGGLQSLFNIDKVRYHTDAVFIVKAEIPAMLLDQLGFYACAPTGGEGSRGNGGWIEEWRTALALSHNIVVADNDKPGMILGERRAALFAADLKFPPEIYKDIDQWYLADPQNAPQVISSWMEEK